MISSSSMFKNNCFVLEFVDRSCIVLIKGSTSLIRFSAFGSKVLDAIF